MNVSVLHIATEMFPRPFPAYIPCRLQATDFPRVIWLKKKKIRLLAEAASETDLVLRGVGH